MVSIYHYLPNFISFIRFLIALFVVQIMPSFTTPFLIAIGFSLIIISFVLDALDGYLSRLWNISSTFGSFVDVFSDRLTEIIFWIFFFNKGMVHPAWVLIFFLRIFLTDTLKIYTFLIGQTANRGTIISGFKKHIVLGNWSRGGYHTLKISLFCYLFLEYTGVWNIPILKFLLLLSTVTFCLVKGSPIVIDYLPRFLMDIMQKNHLIINYSLLKLHLLKRTLKHLVLLFIQMLTEVVAIGFLIIGIILKIIR